MNILMVSSALTGASGFSFDSHSRWSHTWSQNCLGGIGPGESGLSQNKGLLILSDFWFLKLQNKGPPL